MLMRTTFLMSFWAEDAPSHCSRPLSWTRSHQGLLMKKLAVNAGGAIAIVNSSLKENERSRVWLIRGQMPRAAVVQDK